MSICRASASLQEAVRPAASICCDNEDTTEARGESSNGVGGEEKQVEGLGKKVRDGSGIVGSYLEKHLQNIFKCMTSVSSFLLAHCKYCGIVTFEGLTGIYMHWPYNITSIDIISMT